MIRREIQLPNQPKQWFLISQVEHARQSAEIARASLEPFCARELSHLREELLAATLHHDDGWAAWEEAPSLDDQQRPISFREMEIDEDVHIWNRSIDSAAKIGNFAAYVVASHFLSLLKYTDKPLESPLAKDWLQQMPQKRDVWLQAWQRVDPALHTKHLAEQALHWFQLFDVTSLWLCSACPTLEEVAADSTSDYRFGEGSLVDTSFHTTGKPGIATITPWRFQADNLSVHAAGHLVPIRRYASSEELLDARVPHTARWQIVAAP